LRKTHQQLKSMRIIKDREKNTARTITPRRIPDPCGAAFAAPRASCVFSIICLKMVVRNVLKQMQSTNKLVHATVRLPIEQKHVARSFGKQFLQERKS
jgi:hypothetical protein